MRCDERKNNLIFRPRQEKQFRVQARAAPLCVCGLSGLCFLVRKKTLWSGFGDMRRERKEEWSDGRR